MQRSAISLGVDHGQSLPKRASDSPASIEGNVNLTDAHLTARREVSRRDAIRTGLASTGKGMALASALSGVLTTIGCSSDYDSESSTTRRDVPLRILWVGDLADAEIVKRKWDAIAPQTLKITAVPLNRSEPTGCIDAILQQSKSHDLIVFPLLAAAELSAAGAVIPQSGTILGDTATRNETEDSGEDRPRTLPRVYPALRNGAAQFGGEIIGVPLGASLPALLSTDPVESLASWADYHDWVQSEWKGAAAEPLASGWAGQMFLWRAGKSVSSQWLFGTDGMTPQIDQPAYVEVLDLMLRTSKHYQPKRMTPQEIWSGLLSSELRGGIGWKTPSENDKAEISATSLPGTANAQRLILDAFLPVISISSGCRQSAASSDLIKWISSGDGNASLRGQVAGITPTRVMASYDDGGGSRGRESQYTGWLRKRLQQPLLLPTLQLLRGDQYYQAIDSQITKCLDGTSSPAQALGEVAATWSKLNADVGIKPQERAWRRAQGSRA